MVAGDIPDYKPLQVRIKSELFLFACLLFPDYSGLICSTIFYIIIIHRERGYKSAAITSFFSPPLQSTTRIIPT